MKYKAKHEPCYYCENNGTIECKGDDCNQKYRHNFEKMLELTDEHFSDSELLKKLNIERVWL